MRVPPGTVHKIYYCCISFSSFCSHRTTVSCIITLYRIYIICIHYFWCSHLLCALGGRLGGGLRSYPREPHRNHSHILRENWWVISGMPKWIIRTEKKGRSWRSPHEWLCLKSLLLLYQQRTVNIVTYITLHTCTCFLMHLKASSSFASSRHTTRIQNPLWRSLVTIRNLANGQK